MKTNMIDVYSVYSGLYYQVSRDFFILLDDGQLPLLSPPKACKKCYNRGYIGFSQNYMYLICTCIQKNIDQNCLRSKFQLQSTRD